MYQQRRNAGAFLQQHRPHGTHIQCCGQQIAVQISGACHASRCVGIFRQGVAYAHGYTTAYLSHRGSVVNDAAHVVYGHKVSYVGLSGDGVYLYLSAAGAIGVGHIIAAPAFLSVPECLGGGPPAVGAHIPSGIPQDPYRLGEGHLLVTAADQPVLIYDGSVEPPVFPQCGVDLLLGLLCCQPGGVARGDGPP